jgi:hypothetical protein
MNTSNKITKPLVSAASSLCAQPITVCRSTGVLAAFALLAALANVSSAAETVIRNCTFEGPRDTRTVNWSHGKCEPANPQYGAFSFRNQSLNVDDNTPDLIVAATYRTTTPGAHITNVANPLPSSSVNNSLRCMRMNGRAVLGNNETGTCKVRSEGHFYKGVTTKLPDGTKRVYRYQFYSSTAGGGTIGQFISRATPLGTTNRVAVTPMHIERKSDKTIRVDLLFRDDACTSCNTQSGIRYRTVRIPLKGTYKTDDWNNFEAFFTHRLDAAGKIDFYLNGILTSYTGKGTIFDSGRTGSDFKVGIYGPSSPTIMYIDNVKVSSW